LKNKELKEMRANKRLPDTFEWIKKEKFETTNDIKVPERLLDQVIGQEQAVEVVRKAAEQKRHVMLIGDPGTGKSMIAQAMTEFLPREELEDIMAYPNPEDQNSPKIRVVPMEEGKKIIQTHKIEAAKKEQERSSFLLMMVAFIVGISVVIALVPPMHLEYIFFGLIAAIFLYLIFGMGFLGAKKATSNVPKLLVAHNNRDMPPFVDATAAHAGALLGDVRHDPFQAGGLETPAHERVEAGAIHKAHRGVLYIDEINTLSLPSQQHLLTAIQERKFQITGQSEHSAGALVKTESVPCDFVLVCAGNLDAVKGMHPALRSRIRGYGYEVYVNSTMDDSDENRRKLIRLVAQEVKKDKKIPPFDKWAVAEVIHETQRRAGRKGKLSLRLRELGGLIRVAGDIARDKGEQIVKRERVIEAKSMARSLEQQVADRFIQQKKEYKSFHISGAQIGTVNGLAVMSADPSMSEFAGLVLPIVAEVTPAGSRAEGKIIATGKLGEIAKEAVFNASALIKKYMGKDVSSHDIHIQFIGTYEGVEGDSASISVATAVISAMSGVAIDQSIAMTGSLSIRGDVLPVGGVTAKLEAAVKAGLKRVLIPHSNLQDVLLEKEDKKRVKIIPVRTLKGVLGYALIGKGKAAFMQKLKQFEPSQIVGKIDLESEKLIEKIPSKSPSKIPLP
jgi:Lon-like ATP-dependent protease